MVMPQKTEAEITEQDSLLVKGICLYNISYIRGLFHEKYFGDKSVPALEMKVKKLMTLDVESRRLIDLIEKGVYDALQKKYLKTLLFCICEKEEGPMIEEYAFSFSYPNTEEVTMNMSRTGSKKGSTTFTSNASEVTPDQMRSSACKMIRTLVSLMSSLDKMPEERTILMKLMYYDDVTPEDYESPFFKGCADDEAINIWNKNPLKMEVGNVNSKHLVLALKVKSVLDPCDDNSINSGDDSRSMDNDTYQDNKFSDTEIRPSKADRYAVAPNDGKGKGQSTGTISEDDTQDAAHEEELTAKVKEWICSRETGTINVSDDILMEMVEGNERNKTRHYNWNNRPTFTNIITKLFSKKIFSSSASDSSVIKNFAVISLNGTRVQVACSYIKGVIKFRVWNMTKGKSIDISAILGIKRILYTVSSSGTFHFVLTHGDSVLGFVFDGPASWLHAVIKEDHSFQFLSPDPYIDIKAATVLDFTGSYTDLTLNNEPGEIPIGYDALINAFDKILAFKGVSGQEFKTALATIVVHLGEATKFHRVLLACCKAIIYEDFSTLDSIDKNLGLLVKKRGKFSEIGMKTILRAVDNEYIPSLDEVVNSIKKKKVPSVQTLRDILDNLCLYTHGSLGYHGVTIEIEDEEYANDDDSASAKEHKRNEFCPIDDSDDPYAEKTKAYYLRSMGYKYNAEVLNKKGLSSVKTPESDVATEIFERLKSEGLRYALKADPAKRHGMSPLFCASTWGSEIKLHHIGKSFSVNEYWKRRSASTTRKPAANSALSAMMKWRLFSSLARIMKNIK